MADEKKLTPAEADAMIGTVGTVRNPHKAGTGGGLWQGEYRITSYDLDPADDAVVKTFAVETVEMVPEKVNQQAGTSIPAHPKVQAPRVPVRWWIPKAAPKPVAPVAK